MANYITIDGGTTNTRITLLKNSEIAEVMKVDVGAGRSDKETIERALKNGISEIIEKNSLKSGEIECIFVSGMLTSEFGIYPLDHIFAPAGAKELKSSAEKTTIKSISDIPFVFVRGVKTDCTDFENADMMRGEETELMGIMKDSDGECVYVLPGSHSKIIKTDSEGKISGFSTMLSGEMLSALSKNTILRDAVKLEESKLDEDYLIKGFDYCRDNGINKAAFKVRVLKNMFKKSYDETYSFFLGAVLCGEISEIIKENPKKIVIGGKKQIKKAMYEILKRNISGEVVCTDDEAAENAAAFGMMKIFDL